ncbi:MAG TPA: hypothetical protein P5096_03830 [Patescibacteria group bacterium]|nr:hypothetical protein [Patescibacteria group bacterium]
MKLFHLKLRLKRAGYDLLHTSGKSKTFIFIVMLLMASAVYGLSLRGMAQDEGKTKTSAEVFDKIVYYDWNNNTWKNPINIPSSEEITAIATSPQPSPYLFYSTATKLKRIDITLFSPEEDITASYQIPALGNNVSKIVDISSFGNRIVVLENDGGAYYSDNNGSSWQSYLSSYSISKPAFSGFSNNAKRIGVSDSGMCMLYGDGYVACSWVLAPSSIDRQWKDEGRKYDTNIYGIANSIDTHSTYRFISTDKGYILGANDGNSNYTAKKYKSSGGYIFPNIYYIQSGSGSGNYFIFGGAIAADRQSSVFLTLDNNSDTSDPVLRAVIPACETKYSIAYLPNPTSSDLRYAAVVKNSCNPNNPTPVISPTCPTTSGNTYQYKGVSIHTKLENTTDSTMYATAKRGANQTVKVTLTVSNGDTADKLVDVKYILPAGFNYTSGTAKKDGAALADPVVTGSILLWSGFSAKAGDTVITFDTVLP